MVPINLPLLISAFLALADCVFGVAVDLEPLLTPRFMTVLSPVLLSTIKKTLIESKFDIPNYKLPIPLTEKGIFVTFQKFSVDDVAWSETSRFYFDNTTIRFDGSLDTQCQVHFTTSSRLLPNANISVTARHVTIGAGMYFVHNRKKDMLDPVFPLLDVSISHLEVIVILFVSDKDYLNYHLGARK